MAKYLWRARYSVDGTKGLLKVGGSNRRSAIEQLLKEAGGSLEAFYFTFGEDDVIVIAELPDNASAAGIALAISATGSVSLTTTVLLTPEEVDAASRKQVNYRLPGA